MLTTAAFTPPCCDWVLWLTASSWINYRVLPPGPGVVNSWCLIAQTLGIRSCWGGGWGGGLRRRAEKEGWGGGLRRQQHFSAQDSLGIDRPGVLFFSKRQLPFLVPFLGMVLWYWKRREEASVQAHFSWDSCEEGSAWDMEKRSKVDNFQIRMYWEH